MIRVELMPRFAKPKTCYHVVAGNRVCTKRNVNGFPFDYFTCHLCGRLVPKLISYRKEPKRFEKHATPEALRVTRQLHNRRQG